MDAQPVSIDIVVCTYNRASDLDRVLAALAGQQAVEDLQWSVLVVDNASTDNTRQVVDAWRERGDLTNLGYFFEPVQGLSSARARGLRETTGTWIAFVDDDNILASDWLKEMVQAINIQPLAGAFGGLVILDWLGPRRPYLSKLGWCFAEQDHGTEMCEIHNLVGAGMMLRRQALEDSGWSNGMLLQDRVGAKLISGGDVEMVQRIRLAGYRLWYAPRCILTHRIGPDRTRRRHVVSLAFGLGQGAARVSAVCSTLEKGAWKLEALRAAGKYSRWAMHLFQQALLQREDVTVAAAQAAFAAGFRTSIRTLHRSRLIGAALGHRTANVGPIQ